MVKRGATTFSIFIPTAAACVQNAGGAERWDAGRGSVCAFPSDQQQHRRSTFMWSCSKSSASAAAAASVPNEASGYSDRIDAEGARLSYYSKLCRLREYQKSVLSGAITKIRPGSGSACIINKCVLQSSAAERKSNLTNIAKARAQLRLIKDGGRVFFLFFFFQTGNFLLALTPTLTRPLTSTLSNITDKEHIFHVFNHCH